MFARGSYYNKLCDILFKTIFRSLLALYLCCEVKIDKYYAVLLSGL